VGTLLEDLSPGRELIETHISWVLLGKDDVLKLKKPVNLGFLDFSTIERRQAACESELVLNRRLCPQTYEAVVPITVDSDGIHHVGGSGRVVDVAVRMKRLDDATRADNLLKAEQLELSHVERIADELVGFHAGAERSSAIDEFGRVDSIRKNVRENFDQTRNLAPKHITSEQEAQIEAAQLGFLESHQELFDQRIEQGRIRDGHGDLRLEHVYFRGTELSIIDCIEFNDRFRYGDVCADLAFLTMDMRHHGRADYAEHLLSCYAQSSGDYDLYALVDFYEAYRAYVRAKVASFLCEDEGASPRARAGASENARTYYLHALAAQRPNLESPVLVAIGGLIASGKSTTARRLRGMLNCACVDTDRTRKQLLGQQVLTPIRSAPFSGAYDEAFSARVYDEVFRRAEVVLNSGRSVIIDASFRTAATRAQIATLAKQCGVPSYFVNCSVPRDVALNRLHERAKTNSVSDGRVEVYDEFADSWHPPDPNEVQRYLQLDTSGADAHIDGALRSFLELSSRS